MSRTLPLAILVLALSGCGGPRTYPVEGTILYDDGAPARELAGATIELESHETRQSSRGILDDSGRFQISTFKLGDGAVPGKHRVLIMPPPPIFAGGEFDKAAPRPAIDDRYKQFDTANLEITVTPEQKEHTLTVERPKTRR